MKLSLSSSKSTKTQEAFGRQVKRQISEKNKIKMIIIIQFGGWQLTNCKTGLFFTPQCKVAAVIFTGSKYWTWSENVLVAASDNSVIISNLLEDNTNLKNIGYIPSFLFQQKVIPMCHLPCCSKALISLSEEPCARTHNSSLHRSLLPSVTHSLIGDTSQQQHQKFYTRVKTD